MLPFGAIRSRIASLKGMYRECNKEMGSYTRNILDRKPGDGLFLVVQAQIAVSCVTNPGRNAAWAVAGGWAHALHETLAWGLPGTRRACPGAGWIVGGYQESEGVAAHGAASAGGGGQGRRCMLTFSSRRRKEGSLGRTEG